MTATATREQAPAAHAAPPAKGKGKPEKKNFLKSKKAIILLVVVIAAAAGAYLTVLKPKPAPGPVKGGDYVALDATTVNLAGGHYLKIGVSVQLVEGKAVADFQNAHADQLVIDEYSNRTVASLSSNTARAALSTDLEKKLKAAYPDEIFTIYTTQFVTQ